MRTLILIAALATSCTISAQTLTASCKEPTGRALGVLGVLGNNKPVDGTDSMKGGAVTLSWKAGQSKASIVINTGVASSASSVEGTLAFKTDEQLTFFAPFPGAAYMVSLFVTPKRLLMSSHQLFLGMDSGSALAKTFQADCEITVR